MRRAHSQWRCAAAILALLVAWALPPRVGRAADPQTAPGDKRAAAKARLAEGAHLFEQRQYDLALAKLKEAYTLVPSPRIFFNFGMAYRALNRPARALEHFQRFLAEAPDPSGDLRSEAEEYVAELTGAVFTLEIVCDVSGAEVIVDGEPRSTIPLQAPLRLDPGPHDVVVKIDEVAPYKEPVNGVPGGTRRLVVRLRPPIAAAVSLAAAPPRDVSSWKRTVAWGAMGGAALALAGGVVETVVRGNKVAEFNQLKGPDGQLQCNETTADAAGGPECRSLRNSGNRARNWAIAGYTLGGVLAATSVVLFLEGDGSRTAGQLSCAPRFPDVGAGCSVTF